MVKAREASPRAKARAKAHAGRAESKDINSGNVPKERWYGTRRSGFMKWHRAIKVEGIKRKRMKKLKTPLINIRGHNGLVNRG